MTDSHATDHRSAARSDWEARIGRRRSETAASTPPRLDVPQHVRAHEGRGQVTLDWEPVAGAVGYLVHWAASPEGPFEPVDFGGNDVLAVPHPPFTDTTGTPGERRWYAVAAVASVADVGPLSEPVAATPREVGAAAVTLSVDAARSTGRVERPWRPMIGSEHLSHLLSPDTTGGRPIGDELTAALRTCHEELGVQTVRAHGILCDDLGVYREVDGEPVHDFSGVDRVYDRLLGVGMRPVVELSFMPRDLAADPTKTVFSYGAVVSPPKDWDRWADLVRALTAHLVDRYGRDDVRDRWAFEVWNEANLEVFWSGTPEEYLRLYDVTVRAVRDVDPGLVVGGPSSAAAAWVDTLLTHVEGSGSPLDFVSTHTYGAPPLDLRPMLDRHGRRDAKIWWTEWGATPTHFNPVGDEVFAATFLLRGMRSAAGRLDALAHWVASDHFEELGRPPALFHGGFGLLTVGNLRKPRYRALEMLARLGDQELPVALSGDGAGGMVEAWATRDDDGRVGVLVWNGTLDQSKAAGEPLLDRHVTVTLTGLSAGAYDVRHLRIDAEHSNVWAVWQRMAGNLAEDGASSTRAWPTADEWERLRAADRLEACEPDRRVTVERGSVDLAFDLPMPAVSLLELTPSAGVE